MVETVPALLGAGARFVLAGLLMLAFLAVRGGLSKIRASRAQLVRLAVIGTLLAAGGNGLVTVAEKHVPSALAALLIASVPMWIVVFRGLSGDRPVRATLIGVAIGIAGVAGIEQAGNRPVREELGGRLLLPVGAMSARNGSLILPA